MEVSQRPTIDLEFGERLGFQFTISGTTPIDVTHVGLFAATDEDCESFVVEVWDTQDGLLVRLMSSFLGAAMACQICERHASPKVLWPLAAKNSINI